MPSLSLCSCSQRQDVIFEQPVCKSWELWTNQGVPGNEVIEEAPGALGEED